jgi:3-hydroxybutyryl-CoA dehydrogenase
MKIGITGSQNRIDELKEKISSAANLVEIKGTELAQIPSIGLDAFIDLNFDDAPQNLQYYLHLEMPVLLSAVKTQLAKELAGKNPTATFFGINALPTFINRSLLEASFYNEADKNLLETFAQTLDWECKWVDDRVGMVTPRIIFMIVNEAYFTVQEGTANKTDIDTGMKLGTNYPQGPFEWSEKVGLKDVYEVLEAVYQDTHDERYKICPLLKTEYYQSV